jgi:UDP-perosamine 4-acetyltransferase
MPTKGKLKKRERVVLIGSGGHAKEIVEIFHSLASYEILGCLLNDLNQQKLKIPILGNDEYLPELLHQEINTLFLCIGDNARRHALYLQVKKMGFKLANAISPHSIVSPSAQLGEGIAIMPGAVVNTDSQIADNTIINIGATVSHDCRVGVSAHLAPGVNTAGSATIETGAFLGAGCKVIPGQTIGRWSTLGAGSVVINDIPENVLAVGIPAKVIKKNYLTTNKPGLPH